MHDTRQSDADEDMTNNGLGAWKFELGPPPTINSGYDDIYWMDKLHKGLTRAGFYPGDDDIEYWFFGEGTMSAVLTFQACTDQTETGCVDEACWRKLFGADWPAVWNDAAATAASMAAAKEALANPPATAPAAPADLVTSFFKEFAPEPAAPAPAPSAPVRSTAASRGHDQAAVDVALDHQKNRLPVLRDGDGNREVHVMQVALQKQGFYCGEDDMQWWQFGDTTAAALKTFQASSGLPETGVCDENTWKKLVGDDITIDKLHALAEENLGDEYDEDMSSNGQDGRVWLIGEQRWERKRA